MWKYKIVQRPEDTGYSEPQDADNSVAEVVINQLGNAGWELAAVMPRVSGGAAVLGSGPVTTNASFVFKRPR